MKFSGRVRERAIWAALLSGSLFLNLLTFVTPLRAGRDASHRYQQILQNVIYYVKNLYVDPVDEETLLEGAVRGALQATKDPYTRFLNREEHREFNSTEGGEKVGIGVEISLRGGYPVVIAPLEGGPAMKAGVQAGDRIVGVDGKATENLPMGELLKLIGGDVGTVVELEVARENMPLTRTIRITRGVFKLDYVKSAYLDGGHIGYLRLTHFFGESSGAVDEFLRTLKEFRQKKVRGIVLDLRNNPGGHLQMAVTLAGYFLKPNQLVVSARGRNEGMNREYYTGGETEVIPETTPLTVLINGGSASASEILAGALQDHHRAILVGSQSFGKASVQQIIRPLPDDTAALITIQRYYTPANRSIHGVGLKPDRVVADISPDLDEAFYLRKLDEEKYFEKFQTRHSVYSESLTGIVRSETAKLGYALSTDLVRLILKRRYNLPGRSDGPDPTTDPQLRTALHELGE